MTKATLQVKSQAYDAELVAVAADVEDGLALTLAETCVVAWGSALAEAVTDCMSAAEAVFTANAAVAVDVDELVETEVETDSSVVSSQVFWVTLTE